MSAIVFDRTRIDDAATRKGEPSLPLEPGNLFSESEPQRMRAVAGNSADETVSRA
jgi:hypothetical protein